MLMPNHSRSSTVTRPSRPRVARKAKASGTPAKFEATPEKVSTGPRSHFGRSPSVTAAATAKPIRQPRKADAKLIRIEIEKAERIERVKRLAMFAKVNSPAGLRNAPSTTCIVGRIRNSSAKSRNGSTPSQAQERVARAEGAGAAIADAAAARPRTAPGAPRGLTVRWRRRWRPSRP